MSSALRFFFLFSPGSVPLAVLFAFAGLASALKAETLADWAAQHGVPAAQRGPMDMPAGDGVPNLMKYALGAAPLESAAAHIPQPRLIDQGGGPLTLGLAFSANPQAQGVRFVLESTEDLRTWTEVPSVMEPQGNNPDGTVLMLLREASPTVSVRRLSRLRVDFLQAEVLIPAGTFRMGDMEVYGGKPPHNVTLSAFYMAAMHTTWEEWQAVRIWAMEHGYTDLALGAGKAATHPVHSVSWYDVVKWCNAKSEKQGFTPCYYIDDSRTIIYRTGQVAVTNAQVNWLANGFRLPTEAEWEYAARGNLDHMRYPWGDTISHTQANYYAANYAYDWSVTRGYHPNFAVGGKPYTSPVGSFAANGYGLHDMAGNVMQWCWDWRGDYGSAAVTAPCGPSTGVGRLHRGGSWYDFAPDARTASRNYNSPDSRADDVGFRCVRSSSP